MAKDPEEVHPDHGRSASLRVEKMPAQVTVNGQHDLRGREWAYSQNYHPRHHQVEPSEKRHLPQGHARTTHAKDRRDDVDRRSDAAESGDQQAQGPETRAVTEGECV